MEDTAASQNKGRLKNYLPYTMKETLAADILLPVLFLVLLTLLGNPFGAWMPDMVTMAILVILIILLSLYGGFIWKENIRDEREGTHRMRADRVAFLTGMSILTIGIIIQVITHRIDFWLLVALAGMIIAKAVARIYSRNRN